MAAETTIPPAPERVAVPMTDQGVAKAVTADARMSWEPGMLLTDGVAVAYLVLAVEDDGLMLIAQGVHNLQQRWWSWDDVRARLWLVLTDAATAGVLVAVLERHLVPLGGLMVHSLGGAHPWTVRVGRREPNSVADRVWRHFIGHGPHGLGIAAARALLFCWDEL